MNNKKALLGVGLFAIVSLCLSGTLPVFAQGVDTAPVQNTSGEESKKTTDSPGDWYLPQTVERPGESVNCFDYYTFGSVQVDASPLLVAGITPGERITFKGKVKNANPYPIVDGQVYVKIFQKEQVSESALMQNGYPIIDFFLAKDAVFLAANTDQDISFDWAVPSTAAGEYQAAFYFTSAHRYNLLGLSFTDDVTGNKSNFSVTGNQNSAKPVVFDKNSILLNEKEFHPTTFLPRFSHNEKVTASTTLVNQGTGEKTVQVTWVTSRWDGILATNEHKKESFDIRLKPGETRKFSYEVPQLETSVTFLQAIVQDGDTKSILHIRFIRDGYEEVRINFPSILHYPLVQGEENTLFSCVHSTSAPVVPDNTLTLTIRDERGAVVHEYVYRGSVTGEMMGVKDSFVPQESLSTFSLTARLEQGGSVVDEVTMQYDCDQIDKDVCKKEPVAGQAVSSSLTKRLLPIAVLISVFMLGIVAVAYVRRKQKTVTPPRIPPALIVVAIVLSGSFFFPNKGEAASVSWASSGIPNLYGYMFGLKCVDHCGDIVDGAPEPVMEWQWFNTGGFQGPSVTVGYSATVKNTTQNTTGDAVAVAVGDTITFAPTAKSDTDIAWSVTGYSNDTPYGRWSDETDVTCDASTLAGYTEAGNGIAKYWGYVALNISPKNPTIEKGGTATLSCDASGFTCAVTGAGTISAIIRWPATAGYFNYAYTKTGHVTPWSADWLPAGTCRGDSQMYPSGSNPDNGGQVYALSVPEKSVSFVLNVPAPPAPAIDIHF